MEGDCLELTFQAPASPGLQFLPQQKTSFPCSNKCSWCLIFSHLLLSLFTAGCYLSWLSRAFKRFQKRLSLCKVQNVNCLWDVVGESKEGAAAHFCKHFLLSVVH